MSRQTKTCDSCSWLTINGVFCHEFGCPDAWRDELARCFECGLDFTPAERRQSHCEDCIDALSNGYSNDVEEAVQS